MNIFKKALLQTGILGWTKGSNLLRMSQLIKDFVYSDVGNEYKIFVKKKKCLVRKLIKIQENIRSMTPLVLWIEIAKEILTIPKEIEGDIIECGAYLGASSCALSICASLTERKLYVCDSFEGLPDDEIIYAIPYTKEKIRYRKGDFCGKLDLVKQNIARHGSINSVVFIPGYFSSSLKSIPENKKFVFAFLDVDLLSSTKDCIINIWPKMENGCKIYSDDAKAMEIVRLFFDDEFFKKNFGEAAPGFVGSGCGLPLFLRGSSAGFVIKRLNMNNLAIPKWYQNWKEEE